MIEERWNGILPFSVLAGAASPAGAEPAAATPPTGAEAMLERSSSMS